MRKRRLTAWILCLALAAGMLAACSKEPGAESPAGGESTGEATPQAESGEAVTLTMMTTWVRDTAEYDNVTRYSIIDSWLEEHPNVTLQDDSIPHDDFIVKIKALIAADELPDIWSPRGDMIPPAVENEAIYPASEILALVDGWAEEYPEGYLDDFYYDGDYWAIPNQFQGCSYLFVNTELLAECGVDKVPETWEELTDAIVKVKEHDLIPLATGNKSKSPVGDCIMSWLCDRYTGSDWFYSMREKQGARFTDPEFVAALAALQELVELGAFNADANSIDEDMGRSYYLNRETPMFFSGAWSADWLEINAPEDLVAVTQIVLPPSVERAKGAQNAVSGGAGWGVSISRATTGERLRLAADLVHGVTGYGYSAALLELGGARYPTATPPGADFSNIGPLVQQYMDTIPNSVWCADYYVLMEPSPLEVYGNVIQEILVGTVTPEDGAKRIDEAYEQYVLNA